MKTLHLLRHAKSSWDDPTLADHARPLARRGEREAAALAAALPALGLRPELVLCSPAVRARSTYEAIASALPAQHAPRYERDLYFASASALLRRLRRVPDEVSELLVIGHNPGLEDLALLLVREAPEALRIRLAKQLPTCALLSLELALDHWPSLELDTAILRRFWTANREGTRAQARGMASGASQAPKLKLKSRATWGELSEACLSNARSHAYANLSGATRGDMKAIHQLRIALRRLRVVLRAFDDTFEAQAAERAREQARDLFRLLGAVREFDVLREEWIAPLQAKTPDLGLDVLHEPIAKLRRERLRLVQQQLQGSALATFTRALDTLQAHESTADRKPRARARRQLDKHLTVVTELAREVTLKDAQRLHRLRKELKKLRYRADLFAHLFDRKAARAYASVLTRLQDTLGSMQDMAVARTALASVPRVDKARVRAPARARFDASLSARREKVRTQLPRRLAKLRHTAPFWH